DDRRDIRSLVQRQRDPRSHEGREPACRKSVPERRKHVPDEVQLEQRRRCTKQPVVEPRDDPHPSARAERPERDEEPDTKRSRERSCGELKCGKRSPPVRTGGERLPEEMHAEAT